MPVGTSRFSGLGLSLLNVALEPLGQKDRDNRCTEMMTWLRWAYFWSLRLSRIWIYLCIWGTFGEHNPSHFRLSLRFVEWHDLGRSWPWSIWGNITSGFWIHLDTSPTNLVTLAFSCVIHLSNQVWGWRDRSLRWPDCSNSGAAVWCAVWFTGKHGNLSTKNMDGIWAFWLLAWLEIPWYEVVIRESLDLGGCAGEVVTEGVCDDSWWIFSTAARIPFSMKWSGSDLYWLYCISALVVLICLNECLLFGVSLNVFLNLQWWEVPQDDICKSLLHNSRTAGGQKQQCDECGRSDTKDAPFFAPWSRHSIHFHRRSCRGRLAGWILYDLVAIPSLWQSWMIRMTNGFDMLWHNDICWGLTLCPVAHLEGAALKLGMGWRFGGWWLIYVDICWYCGRGDDQIRSWCLLVYIPCIRVPRWTPRVGQTTSGSSRLSFVRWSWEI